MGQDEGLQADNQVFVRRKNKVIGELDLAVEVLTATFGVELYDILRQRGFHFVLMMVLPAMHAVVGCIDKATCRMVVFSAVMELHIPTDRDKQHGKGHQEGTDLQQSFFHAAKVGKKVELCRFFL